METEHKKCPLNPLQNSVIMWTARGLTAEQVAAKLGYSKKYVQNILQDIQETLGTSNKVESVAESLVNGCINLPPKDEL